MSIKFYLKYYSYVSKNLAFTLQIRNEFKLVALKFYRKVRMSSFSFNFARQLQITSALRKGTNLSRISFILSLSPIIKYQLQISVSLLKRVSEFRR